MSLAKVQILPTDLGIPSLCLIFLLSLLEQVLLVPAIGELLVFSAKIEAMKSAAMVL